MPENEPNSLDDLLRNKFEQFGSEPSDKVWENIAAAVEQENRRKRRYLLWVSLSTVMIALMVGLGTYFWLKDRKTGPELTTNPQTVGSQPAPAVTAPAVSPASSAEPAAPVAKSDVAGKPAQNSDLNQPYAEKRATDKADTDKSSAVENLTAAKASKAARPAANQAKVRTLPEPAVTAAATPKSEAATPAPTAPAARKAAETAAPEKALATTQASTAAREASATNASAASTQPAAPVKAAANDVPQETKADAPAPVTPTASAPKQTAATPEPASIAANTPKPAAAAPEKAVAADKKSAPETGILKAPETTNVATISTEKETEKAEDAARVATPDKPLVTANTTPAATAPAITSPAAPEKQVAATVPEIDHLEEETGIWARDTTGLTVAPPKDTTEIKEPHAIPVRAVEIFGSPEYGFRSLAEAGLTNYGQTRNLYESAGVGFSGGVNMTFGVTRKFGVKTGLHYLELREKLSYPEGFLTNNATHSSYKFVTLPLYLVYESRGYSNFSVEFAAGPNLNMYVGGQSVILDSDNGYELKKWGDSGHIFQTYNLSATAGIGFNYRVSKLISLMLRPTFTYFPWSVTKDNHPGQKPYCVGAQTGIRIGF